MVCPPRAAVLGSRTRVDAYNRSITKPLTGEPDAGDPPVRFGGRGKVQSLVPTPIVLFGCFTTRVARPRCGGGGRRAREYQSYPRRVSGEWPVTLPRLSPASTVGLAHVTEAPRASRARGILGWLGCRLGDSSARRKESPGVARNQLGLRELKML